MGLSGACSEPGDRSRDLIRGFYPMEWFGLRVVRINVGADRCSELLRACMRSAAQRVVGEEPEEALDLIQPRRVGGREVQLKARVAQQPALSLQGSCAWRDCPARREHRAPSARSRRSLRES